RRGSRRSLRSFRENGHALAAVVVLVVLDLGHLADGDRAFDLRVLLEIEAVVLAARAFDFDPLSGLVILDRANDRFGLRLHVGARSGLFDRRLRVLFFLAERECTAAYGHA